MLNESAGYSDNDLSRANDILQELIGPRCPECGGVGELAVKWAGDEYGWCYCTIDWIARRAAIDDLMSRFAVGVVRCHHCNEWITTAQEKEHGLAWDDDGHQYHVPCAEQLRGKIKADQ